jgi:hypothetical protein
MGARDDLANLEKKLGVGKTSWGLSLEQGCWRGVCSCFGTEMRRLMESKKSLRIPKVGGTRV